jgi:hypothetical protein
VTSARDASALGAGVKDADGGAGDDVGERTVCEEDCGALVEDCGTLVEDCGELLTLAVDVAEGARVPGGLGVVDGDAPRESDDVCVRVPVGVGVAVALAVPVIDAVRVAVLVAETGDAETVGEFDGVAPFESVADGVDVALDVVLAVVDRDCDVDGVGDDVSGAVPVGVGVSGGVCDALFVALNVLNAVPVLLPVALGDAPVERLCVAVALIVLLADTVELGVSDDVAEAVAVDVEVDVTLAVVLVVGEEERDVVLDADAVLVSVAVLLGEAPGDRLGVLVALLVVDAL